MPFVALQRQHAALAEELTAAFERVVAANGFILGAEVDAFEAEFAAYCGVEHAVGVSSGTAALAIALRAADVGPGDEVVVPAHTFVASALAVAHAGAVAVLCDVDPDTGLMDPEAAAAAVTPRTAALLPVHLYGQMCDMRALGTLAARHGLLVVEDCAQAHGARDRRRLAGAAGDVGCFSFYPSKNLGALGDGGAICTNNPLIATRARMLRNLGQRRKGEHAVLGYNDRLHGLQAALLRVKLPHLDGWNAARRAHAARYREGLEGRARLLAERPGTESVHHLLPIRVPRRDRVAVQLGKAGIQTGVHYSPALPQQPALEGVARQAHDCRHARAWAAEELSLPMFAELRDAEVDRVLDVCAELLG